MQQYVIVSRKNPLKPDENSKFYALARSLRKVDVDEICKRISERSSYSRGELEGCIGEFLIEVQNVLLEGSIANVGKLGSFRLTLQTYRPTSKLDDFSNSHVKGCKINFRPSIQMKEICKTMKYTPYKTDPNKEEAETPKQEAA